MRRRGGRFAGLPSVTLLPLTFLFPRDDLGVGAREQEVKLQGNVGDQVLQDGGLLAAVSREEEIKRCVYLRGGADQAASGPTSLAAAACLPCTGCRGASPCA